VRLQRRAGKRRPHRASQCRASRDGPAFLLPANRIPVAQASDQPLVTGSSGMVGYVEVPPGSVELRGFRAGEAEPFGSAQLGVVPGQLSMASLRPAYLLDANVVGRTIELSSDPAL